jgi:uncharacterized protein (DUF1800 family)
MNLTRRDLLKVAGSSALFAGAAFPAAAQEFSEALTAARARPNAAPNAASVHFLNRISYGATADELARVAQMGIPAYLNQQLNNAAALEDAVLKRKMAPFKELNMTVRQLERLADPTGAATEALVQGMVTRAVYSKAQLHERMVEFWSDHFNIAAEGLELDYIQFQREVIRKNVFGTFYDLLVATAKSPAMLVYLDNYLNEKEHPNENYGREVMELHTLSVTGGYTEDDVINVARAFTGWTVDDKKKTNAGMVFSLEEHDTGPKTILGHQLPAGRGIEDGMDVLRILADHPSTAKFICRKLSVRFVADNPPQSLIDKMVATWTQNKGAIKPVLQTLFLSDEFNASVNMKLRRPLDLVIGAMRATGTDFTEFNDLAWILEVLAQIPYNWHPPNGYPEPAAAWVNTSALLGRWNAVFILSEGRLQEPEGHHHSSSHPVAEDHRDGAGPGQRGGHLRLWRAASRGPAAAVHHLGFRGDGRGHEGQQERSQLPARQSVWPDAGFPRLPVALTGPWSLTRS